MSRNNCFVAVMAILIIPLIMMAFPMGENSPVYRASGAQPPALEDTTTFWDGDWNVDSDAVYTNQTIIVNGNLTVLFGSSLTLINVTIKMNNTGNMTTFIHVNNGAGLFISDFDGDPLTTQDGCVITSNITDDEHRFGFYVHQNTVFSMVNSAISQVGHNTGADFERGIYIHTPNAIIRNSTISDGYRGIYISEGSGSIIENCRFYNLEDDVLRIHSSSNTLVYNNNIEVNGSNDFGIYIESDSWRNRIVGNTINVTGSNAEGIRDSSSGRWNDIEQNQFNLYGGVDGIRVYSSYTNITSNTIYAWGDNDDGIQLSFGSFIVISDNTIVGSGMNVCGIQIGPVNNISLSNNDISVGEDNCLGMDLGFGAHDVFIDGLTVTITSGINNFGMYFDSVYDITIANSSIIGAQRDMDINSDSHVLAINTSFSSLDISGGLSDLTIQNYLDLTVEDWTNAPQAGALVSIENVTGSLEYSGSSDVNGEIRYIPLTEVVHYQGSSTFLTPHNITVTQSGYDIWNGQVIMDQNQGITATLIPEGAGEVQQRGDWWIDTTEEYWNTRFLMDGNITINATGNLILNNCTVMFNCTSFSGQYHMNVTWGGELHLYDNDWDNNTMDDASVISDSPYDIDDGSASDFAFSFYAWGGSVIEVRNSHIIDCGWESISPHDEGIYVETNSAVFNHAYINGNFIGINFGSSSNSIVYNSTITINGYWNFASAIRAWDCPNLQILNNIIDITITSNDDLGIFVGFSQGAIISGNQLHMSGALGVNYGMLLVDSSGYNVEYNTITFNTPGMAIYLHSLVGCSVVGNDILVSMDFGTGLFIADVTNSIIDGNSVRLDDVGNGLYLTGLSSGTTINDLTVSSSVASVDGVYMYDGHWATFSNISIDLQGVGSYGFFLNNSENCTISDLDLTVPNTWGGGLLLVDGSRNNDVESATVSTNGFIPALYCRDSTENWLYNSTFDSVMTFDVEVLENAIVTLVNPNFLDYSISGPLSTLTVMWYLDVQVIDEFGQPFPGIDIRIEEADSTLVRNSVSGANGWLNWSTCVGYVATEVGMFNSTNPHQVHVSNATCWDETQVDLTNQNQVVIIGLINEDPVISDPAFNINVMEDSTYNRIFHATDWEGNPFSWSINTSESWISMGPLTGNLSINPTNDNVGSHTFSIRVMDINGGFDEFSVVIDVENKLPKIITADIITAVEDSLYIVDYDSSDDPQTTWNLVYGPLWLSLNSLTGILTGTPDNSDVGSTTVNISVEDSNGGIVWRLFTLEVTNTPPIITTLDDPQAIEDDAYQVDYTSSDDGQGTMTWTLVTDATWLSINSTTGILSGTPDNTEVGDLIVNVTVYDGNGGFAFSNFTITVENTPPIIITDDVIWSDEDNPYINNYASSDDGQGTMIWTLISDATWLSINSITGILSGTPKNEDVGVYWVNVTVDDGNSGVGFHNFSLTVNNTNDAPVISTQDMDSATEDLLYFVYYRAEDDDLDIVTWSLTTSATWLSIGSLTGELSGTPSNLDVRSWDITVSCDDGNGGVDSHVFTINVVNVNDEPQITNFNPTDVFPSVEEGMSLDFNISYSDEDSSIFTITWTLDGETVRQNVPFWSYQPDFESEGDHDVIVNITDSEGASVEKSWIVIVTNSNRAPQIDTFNPMNIMPIIGPEETEITFTIGASDPDSDSLSYQWFLDGNDTGERASEFTMYRTKNGEGTFHLEVQVTDGNGTTTSQTWDITVQPLKAQAEDPESNMLLPILAIVVIAVVVLILAYLMTRKKSEIEDIFIITNNGILLAHKSKEFHPDMDDDIMGSMITAVQDFVKDSFKEKSKYGLKRLDFGDSVIHIQRGEYVYAAVILSGDEPSDFEETLEKAVTDIETKYDDVLKDWDGDLDSVRGLKDMLDDLVK